MPRSNTPSPWQQRVQRAHELSQQYPFAAEILNFYIHVAEFQEKLSGQLSGYRPPDSNPEELGDGIATELAGRFESFLSLAENNGPAALAEITRAIRAQGGAGWSELLRVSWADLSPIDARVFLVQAFLQPYAEIVRSHSARRPSHSAYGICPF